MDFRPVEKPGSFTVLPNLGDYATARESFDWDQVSKYLDGLPGGRINIAHEAIDGSRGEGPSTTPPTANSPH
jgi:acetyl-CoA synthetase